MKVVVHAQAWASATVYVELDDETLDRIAKDLEKPVSELTVDDIVEVAEDKAFSEQGMPSLCASCCGMGYGDNYSLDLGDFEPVDENPVEITER